jgi:hypothetical protein
MTSSVCFKIQKLPDGEFWTVVESRETFIQLGAKEPFSQSSIGPKNTSRALSSERTEVELVLG